MGQKIAELDADIVALMEVQDCVVLQRMIAAMPSPQKEQYKPYLIFGTTRSLFFLVSNKILGTDTGTDQNVAIVTKVDPTVDLKRITTRAVADSATSACGATGTTDSGISKNLYTTYCIDVNYSNVVKVCRRWVPRISADCGASGSVSYHA